VLCLNDGCLLKIRLALQLAYIRRHLRDPRKAPSLQSIHSHGSVWYSTASWRRKPTRSTPTTSPRPTNDFARIRTAESLIRDRRPQSSEP